MQKAAVEIDWGTPCKLTATFEMVNSSDAPQNIRVGFPMPSSEFAPRPSQAPDDLTMTFDGEPAPVTPPGAGREDVDSRRAWVWFHCPHTFKPGTTTVVVQAPLYASRVPGGPYQESLFYCIETGGNWAGTIGEEEMTIRFPHPIEKDQITQVSPADHRIEGNSVRWRFVDFKPRSNEYDVALTYLRPDVMRTLVTLRRDWNQHPDSSVAAVKLAKHLLVLGSGKSNSGFPPSRLTKEQFASLQANIASRADKKTFVAHYRPNAAGNYEEVSTEWTPERLGLIQILADAGYRDERSNSPFILEGERLLKDTLARDPHNAEAWNVYLASYWRFSFAAVGHGFGMTRLSQSQAKLIETAAANCPEDECLKLWLALRRAPADKRNSTELLETIQRRGFLQVDYPKLEYGYY